jgi:arabinofuranosyltransferase
VTLLKGRIAGAIGNRPIAAAAVLVGLGPLIRPEFALYSATLLLPLVSVKVIGRDGSRLRRLVPAVSLVALCAGALPVAYQVFRMSYYASVTPNTAIAKEAFLGNWEQGRCYFENFFGTYHMVWPLTAAAVFWIARLRDHFTARRWQALALTAGLPVAATIHAVYLVGIGGDYMHGRLFVPSVFAALMPVMMVPLPAPPLTLGGALTAASGALVAAWLPICAFKLRVGVENVCNIGDERGWYSRLAVSSNPVTLDSYRSHSFYDAAQKELQRIEDACPSLASFPVATPGPGCRRVYIDEDKTTLAPAPTTAVMARGMDSSIGAVSSAGAIGIFGYLVPQQVHVVDQHGLTDPLVARFELQERGRPGHEKKLSPAWMLARFSEPAPDEDAAVAAARHALHCGMLSSLGESVTGPLNFRALLENFSHAWAFARLRVPRDPFDAEVRFCNTPPMPEVSTGGGGGVAFRWRCPGRSSLSGLRGEFKPQEHAISRVQPLCTPRGEQEGESSDSFQGPSFGESSDMPFEVSCPGNAILTGLHGWSDNLVRSIGVACLEDGAARPSNTGGEDRGHTFQISCPHDAAVLGVVGRSGALVDAVGLLCAP